MTPYLFPIVYVFHNIENFQMDIQKHAFLKQMCNASYVWS